MKAIFGLTLSVFVSLWIIAGTAAYGNILVVVHIDEMMPANGTVAKDNSCGVTASIQSLTINDSNKPDKTELDAEGGISYLSWEVTYAGGGGTIDGPAELLICNPTHPDQRPNPSEGASITTWGKFSQTGARHISVKGIVYVFRSLDYLSSGDYTAYAGFTITE